MLQKQHSQLCDFIAQCKSKSKLLAWRLLLFPVAQGVLEQAKEIEGKLTVSFKTHSLHPMNQCRWKLASWVNMLAGGKLAICVSWRLDSTD